MPILPNLLRKYRSDKSVQKNVVIIRSKVVDTLFLDKPLRILNDISGLRTVVIAMVGIALLLLPIFVYAQGAVYPSRKQCN